MILKLIGIAVLLYYIALLWEYIRHGLPPSSREGTDNEETGDGHEEKPEETASVIGKSTYRPRQRNEPEDKHGSVENQIDKTDNFADEMKKAPIGNDTEQAEETTTADDDADYSDIEVEPEEEEMEGEYTPTPEEVEEEEELGAYYPDNHPDFATGYTFEDLKKVHHIMVTDEAGEQEKQQAREVLPAVMGSDVWDEMLNEFEGARERVARLMNSNV